MAVEQLDAPTQAATPVRTPATGRHRWLAFGDGLGVEITARDLRATAVRVRPSGVRHLDSTVLADYADRPATEWGADLMDSRARRAWPGR